MKIPLLKSKPSSKFKIIDPKRIIVILKSIQNYKLMKF
ncbi:hypothetical protein BBU64B_K0010 (plasmid) [Borreliella burgdorferi 64b]|nr:hypothetical protein BBU64B_K0010 [Borreliella burgdorferi 64b]